MSIIKTKEEALDYEELMKEYLSIRYQKLQYETIAGQAEEALLNVAEQMTNPLIVMGAFGRSAISRLFSRSTASALLKNQSLPIFITHK